VIGTAFVLSAVLVGSAPVVPVRVLAQEATTPAPAPAQAADPAQQLVLPGATRAPDCGGRAELARIAFCVTAPIGTMNALGEAYVAKLGETGWLAADGSDNRVVFVRRRDGGGCDGLQMLAFYNEDQPVDETTPGFFALTTIPGDVCASASAPAQPAAPETTPQ
jgi:hypothetical protein